MQFLALFVWLGLICPILATNDPTSLFTAGSSWIGAGERNDFIGIGAPGPAKPFQYRLLVTARDGDTFKAQAFVPPTSRIATYSVAGTVTAAGQINWKSEDRVIQAEFSGTIDGESIKVDFSRSSRTKLIAKGTLTLELDGPLANNVNAQGGLPKFGRMPAVGLGQRPSSSTPPTTGNLPRGNAPVAPTGLRIEFPDTPAKLEYEQFARAYTMASEKISEYLRTAPERADLLSQIDFKDPALQRATLDFTPIALAYREIDAFRQRNSNASPAEIVKTLVDIWGGSDDLIKNVGFQNMLANTAKRAVKVEAAKILLFHLSGMHGQLWESLLPSARAIYGPNLNVLPLRFGNFWALNTSGVPLTHLTLIIQTNASESLSKEARTHVIYVERLEADEMVHLPPWLVDAIPPSTPDRPIEGVTNCFQCTILSDQATCFDVKFDFCATLKTKAWWQRSGNGFVPSPAFQGSGSYDAGTPIVNIAEDQLQEGSRWFGTGQQHSPRSRPVRIELIATKRSGNAFEAEMRFGSAAETFKYAGTIEKDILRLEGLTQERDPRDGRGIPAEGEILGNMLDLFYTGPGHLGNPQQGEIRLVRAAK